MPNPVQRANWRRIVMRPSLLSLTAAAAGVSAIAHAMTMAGGAESAASPFPPPTRMGVSIQQSLSERDQDLVRRTRAANLREQSARATEQRLKAELESRQNPLGAPNSAQSSAMADAPQPIENLARIYQTMKPARAAPIFEALDLDVQTQIAWRMRERAIALIMANMEPDAAVRLSMALAGRRPAPLAFRSPSALAPAQLAYAGMQPQAPRDRGKPGYAPPPPPTAGSLNGRPMAERARMAAPASARPRLQAPRVQPIAVPGAAQAQTAAQDQPTPSATTPAAAK